MILLCQKIFLLGKIKTNLCKNIGLGGSVGCVVRLEIRRSRVQPPPRSATFFHGDWSWNIFYGHSLPSIDSRRAGQFLAKECAQYWLTDRGLSLPSKWWLGKLTTLGMTPLGWLGHKTSTQKCKNHVTGIGICQIQVLQVQIPDESHNFCGNWLWNNFYGYSPPFIDSRRAVINNCQIYRHKVLVNGR